MFVMQKAHELWALIYIAVKKNFTVVISLLKQPPFCAQRQIQEKHYTLMHLLQQIEPGAFFTSISIIVNLTMK